MSLNLIVTLLLLSFFPLIVAGAGALAPEGPRLADWTFFIFSLYCTAARDAQQAA